VYQTTTVWNAATLFGINNASNASLTRILTRILAGLGCGPGAPICVGAGVLIGGIAGGLGADYLVDKTIKD